MSYPKIEFLFLSEEDMIRAGVLGLGTKLTLWNKPDLY